MDEIKLIHTKIMQKMIVFLTPAQNTGAKLEINYTYILLDCY